MDESIYFENILNEKVSVYSNELKNKVNIEELLLRKLSNKLEGKCIRQGYVKPNSIKILTRSVGQVLDGHFNGDIVYKLKIKVDLCNPVEGQQVNCYVHNINKMGIIASLDTNPHKSPLQILIARHHHQENELFQEIEVGDFITIEIIGTKFQLNDKKIHAIGELLNKNEKKQKKRMLGGRVNIDDIDIMDKERINQNIMMIDNYLSNNLQDEEEKEEIEKLINTNNINIEKWNKTTQNDKIKLLISNLKENDE